MEHINFLTITPCGECCTGCSKKKEGICNGCIETEGQCKEWAQSNGCPIYKCAHENSVQFCGLCDNFPCDWLVNKVVWNPNIVNHLSHLAQLYHKQNKE